MTLDECGNFEQSKIYSCEEDLRIIAKRLGEEYSYLSRTYRVQHDIIHLKGHGGRWQTDVLSGVAANILTGEIVQSVEKFICKAYNLPSDINTVVLFPTARKLEALPPTSEALHHQMEGTFPNVGVDQCTPPMCNSSTSNRFLQEA